MNEYDGVRRISYGQGEYEGATFIPVCPACGRFVKADATMHFRGDTIADEPNATCSKCGRVKMLFEGFM